MIFQNDTLLYGHIGDSRLYQWRDGTLSQLTLDDNEVTEDYETYKMTPEIAMVHPLKRIVTHYLPTKEGMEIKRRMKFRGRSYKTIGSIQTRPGDRYLLCTDGVVDAVTDEEIAHILGEQTSLTAKALALLNNIHNPREMIQVDLKCYPTKEVDAGNDSNPHRTRIEERTEEDARKRLAGKDNATFYLIERQR